MDPLEEQIEAMRREDARKVRALYAFLEVTLRAYDAGEVDYNELLFQTAATEYLALEMEVARSTEELRLTRLSRA